MALTFRYSREELEYLRNSPLVTKPPNLPPKEEYLGTQQPENTRTGARSGNDRDRSYLGDSSNRRPGSRPGNPDDTFLGPPRTAFPSTTPFRTKLGDGDRTPRESEGPRERLGIRGKDIDGDGDGHRYREGRNNTLRPRRGEVDQDSDGWTPVKPRKSFGHDGAERFHGRMGGERNEGGERRQRDREDRDRDRDRDNQRDRDRDRDRDRRQRNFEGFGRDRDRDGADGEPPRRNGLNRNRSDAPWHKEGNDGMSQRDKIDKLKNWRDRAGDADADTFRDKDRDRERQDRYGDRRWNRDREARQEAEPEWMDEPVTGATQPVMNQDQFVEYMKSLKKGGGQVTAQEPAPAKASEPEPVPKAEPAPEPEPPLSTPAEPSEDPMLNKTDKFFEKFAQVKITGEKMQADTDVPVARPKLGAAKPSRFVSFFGAQQQEGSRRHTEPPTPAANAPPPPPDAIPASNPVPAANEIEQKAFKTLLQKLEASSHRNSPPATKAFQPPPRMTTPQEVSSLLQQHASPEPPPQFSFPRRDDGRPRLLSQPSLMQQDLSSPRTMLGSNPAAMRSEQQMVQELVNQRNSMHSQGSGRHEPQRNSNAEFLMGLMQSARNAPEPPRNDELLAKMHQQQQHQQQMQQLQAQQARHQQPPQSIMHIPGREPDFLRAGPQRPMGRGPPGFPDEQFHHHSDLDRQQQPTHILQRPPPPGLEHLPPSWMSGPGGLTGPAGGPVGLNGPGGPGGPPPGAQIPSHQRQMIPPPGLAGPGNPQRNGGGPPGMAPNMYQPNFGGGPGFPDNMVGPPPPRSMQAPPPGLFAGPPFAMPPPGMHGLQGPDGMPPFGGPGGPSDGRGMPPHFMRRP